MSPLDEETKVSESKKLAQRQLLGPHSRFVCPPSLWRAGEMAEYVVTIPIFYQSRAEVIPRKGQRLSCGCEQPQPSELRSVHPGLAFSKT